MPEADITEPGVIKLLKNLKPRKVYVGQLGHITSNPWFSKNCTYKSHLFLPLSFQKSAKTGELPTEWRQANVVPIFKKGQKHLPENYRPVSLTLICSIIMEHILASNIMQHLEGKSILYQNQQGFRARRSCETQLVELVEDLHGRCRRDTRLTSYRHGFLQGVW